jgi:AmmeMemoRadiSam system protein A
VILLAFCKIFTVNINGVKRYSSIKYSNTSFLINNVFPVYYGMTGANAIGDCHLRAYFSGGFDMTQLSTEDKRYLLQLARSVILDHLGEKTSTPPPERSSSAFLEKRGCFVTLHSNDRLRGCIGIIDPIKSLIAGVKENAINAGFQDSRFSPVTVHEMEHITIEISILTKPVSLHFQNIDELKKLLKPGVHGVILSQGSYRATFLPQVWEQLPGTEDFLGHLCQKAGMEKTCWKDTKTAIKVYEVSVFSEKDMKRIL